MRLKEIILILCAIAIVLIGFRAFNIIVYQTFRIGFGIVAVLFLFGLLKFIFGKKS